jgi:hypothetical protein
MLPSSKALNCQGKVVRAAACPNADPDADPSAGRNADTPHPSQVFSLRETGRRVNELRLSVGLELRASKA